MRSSFSLFNCLDASSMRKLYLEALVGLYEPDGNTYLQKECFQQMNNVVCRIQTIFRDEAHILDNPGTIAKITPNEINTRKEIFKKRCAIFREIVLLRITISGTLIKAANEVAINRVNERRLRMQDFEKDFALWSDHMHTAVRRVDDQEWRHKLRLYYNNSKELNIEGKLSFEHEIDLFLRRAKSTLMRRELRQETLNPQSKEDLILTLREAESVFKEEDKQRRECDQLDYAKGCLRDYQKLYICGRDSIRSHLHINPKSCSPEMTTLLKQWDILDNRYSEAYGPIESADPDLVIRFANTQIAPLVDKITATALEAFPEIFRPKKAEPVKANCQCTMM